MIAQQLVCDTDKDSISLKSPHHSTGHYHEPRPLAKWLRRRESFAKVGVPCESCLEILLIEPNLADARLAIEAFKDWSRKHRLTLVRDAREALAFLRREQQFTRAPRPDLILLNLELPSVDGRQLLDQIKSDSQFDDIPVVVLAFSELHIDILRQQNVNADGFAVMPVVPEALLEFAPSWKNAARRRV